MMGKQQYNIYLKEHKTNQLYEIKKGITTLAAARFQLKKHQNVRYFNDAEYVIVIEEGDQ